MVQAPINAGPKSASPCFRVSSSTTCKIGASTVMSRTRTQWSTGFNVPIYADLVARVRASC